MPFDFDLARALSQLTLLIIAYALALPIGWNREMGDRSAGLRTFPLVALASCAYVLVGQSVLQTDDALARIMYGLMVGIGFIGGGAILKRGSDVYGTATAASIWNTGAIGMSVALERLEVALALMLLNLLTLWLGAKFKPEPEEEPPPDA